MIVIARNYGQLGNRLVLAAHLIAAAREFGVTLVNPSFVRYAKYFRSTANDLWCRYSADQADPFCIDDSLEDCQESQSHWKREVLYRTVYLTGRTLSHLRLTKFPFHVVRLGHHGYCDLNSDEFRRKATSRRPVLVSGWHFDAGHLLVKHADAIRDHFRVKAEHEDNVESLIGEMRRDNQTIIGVHIRHGDYANFMGGKYHYPINQYVAAMRRIRRRFAGQDIAFLVCGNSKLRREDFGDLNVRFGTGQLIEDMYSFARCDRLVGPPSTFTGWASFYGNVPLHRMMSAEESFMQINEPIETSVSSSLASV